MASIGKEPKIQYPEGKLMKKIFIACVAVLILTAVVSAQTKFNFGVKAGVSVANNLWSDDDGTEGTVLRPTFGVFALINLSPMLAIQPELNYLVMGEQWDITEGTAIEAFTYLHIPVLLRARLMKEGKFVPVVFAGPAIGILLSAKDTGEDVKSFFKSTDFGADFGLGAEVGMGKMKGLVDLRYYMGLTNAYAFAPTKFSMKNRGFIFTVGLIF
jgi:hypothetical protein